ncbi:MAG: ABC transporter permease [Clostridia bacterium]|nr:ABC transporter permease [Clostridia bacterium]
MLKYILKRLGWCILILLGVSLILYILVRSMPTDFIQAKINSINQGGATVDEATEAAMYESYGLEPYPENATFWEKTEVNVRGYFSWLKSVCTLDFGNSFTNNQPVVDVITNHMGVSFWIALIATVFEFMIAIPLGITAARHQYSVRDYVVTILVMIGISLPSFFFGQVLRDVFANKLGWFPPLGLSNTQMVNPSFGEMVVDYIWHLFVPILTVVILSIGARMRMTRTNMLEVLNSDYIRTARAKGAKERVVIYKHAFRNTMIPLVTSLAGLLPSLFSGAMITEQVFNLPGIGNVALKSMMSGDIPFIMGYNMFLALLSVVGVLLSDLMYAVVDPRVKLK